jgi:hypothetical protein
MEAYIKPKIKTIEVILERIIAASVVDVTTDKGFTPEEALSKGSNNTDWNDDDDSSTSNW